MWELDYKESWVPKNWCFWTVLLEKTLESPSDCKEIQPVHPKGNQSWIFIGRTDAKAETPILWPPDVKNKHIGKDLDAGKDWRQEEKGMTEGEMVGWHHRCDGHEFEWVSGVGDGQGSLACFSPWDSKELDMTEWLNWTEESDDTSPTLGLEVWQGGAVAIPCMCVQLLQSCLTLCNFVDCSPPSSSAHGILQARILEWVAMPFSRGSSPSRDRTWVSCIFLFTGRFFTAEPCWKPEEGVTVQVPANRFT